MVAFYKHNIADWRGGTVALSDRAYRVYHVIVEQIMLYEGDIPAHERTLAGLSNRSVRDLKAALVELVDAGKIAIEGDRITNRRALSELVHVRNNRENSAKGGRVLRERSARGQREVCDTGEKANEIKEEEQAPLIREGGPKREEKRRVERVPSVPSVPQVDTQRGRARARGARLEVGWQASPEDRAFCAGLGFDEEAIDETLVPEFRDYWSAVPGSRGLKLDWSATFRNRVREVSGRRGPSSKPNGVRSKSRFAHPNDDFDPESFRKKLAQRQAERERRDH